jgi:competence protein ComEC
VNPHRKNGPTRPRPAGPPASTPGPPEPRPAAPGLAVSRPERSRAAAADAVDFGHAHRGQVRRRTAEDRAPDLRLAGFAIALWLAALASLYLSVRSGLILGGTALVAAAGTALMRCAPRAATQPHPRRSHLRSTAAGATGAAIGAAGVAAGAAARAARAAGAVGAAGAAGATARAAGAVRWLVAAVLLGAGCGATATAARVSVRDAGPLVALVDAGATVRVDLVVRDDPRALRGSPGLPPTYLVAVDLTAVHAEGEPRLRLSARALVLGSDPAWRSLLPGQHASATGRLLAPRGGDLRAAVVSVRDPPRLRGRSSWAQRAAGALRAGLQRACAPLPDDVGGLLPGLVVGDTSRLDEAVEEDFRTTGMTHLNAVSGANVAIILGVVLFAVRWTRAGPLLTACLCAVALAGFVILARPSPSVVRAAAMGAIGLIGLAAGRHRAALPALAAGVAVLIVVDPELAGDLGFALSVLATGGLLLLAPKWRDALRRRGWPAVAAEALAVPAAAQVACGPVVAGISGSVSLVAVPANLLVVPAIAPATLFGVSAAVLSPSGRSGRSSPPGWGSGRPGGWCWSRRTAPGCPPARCRGRAGCRARCCSPSSRSRCSSPFDGRWYGVSLRSSRSAPCWALCPYGWSLPGGRRRAG